MGRFLLVCIAAGLASIASPVFALRVVPIVLELAPKGPGATQLVRVENETPQSIAVQVSMFRRSADIDGKETRVEAEDDFVVFPPQLVLLPGENRAVRLQWIGETAPVSELAYRMIVEQLPVEIGDAPQGARVRIVMRYEGAVYIVPPGARPNIAIEEARPVPQQGGGTGLAVTVRNSGTKHLLLNELRLDLRSEGRAVTLGPESLQGMTGQNVLAGQRRRFVLPWPAGLPVGGVDASLEYRAAP